MFERSACTKWLLATVLLLLSLISGQACASIGTVAQLSGTISVRKPDGTVRLLSRSSEIAVGDTIDTQRDSYALIRFGDGARITLKPNSSLKILRFNYAESEPQDDAFSYSLLRGGLRVVSGVVGSRGDPDAHQLITSSAVIGVKGSDLGRVDCQDRQLGCSMSDAVYVSPGMLKGADGILLAAAGRAGTFSVDDCSIGISASAGCADLEPGVFVSVSDGGISLTNSGGTTNVLAGQAAVVAGPERRASFLSIDPGLQFTPPASFVQSLTGGSAVNAGRSLECAIRR